MASRRARREADLFWSDLVGRGAEWVPQVRVREEADLFLDGLRGRQVPFEDIAEDEKKKKKKGVPRELPTLTAAIAARTALFELLPWSAEWKDPADENKNMWGFFWMFSDALMWEAPKSGKWASWTGTTVAHPLPRTPFGGVKITDRTRLVRLPCTGQEATAAADRLTFSQADLRASAGGDLAGPPDGNDRKVPSLLPTPELYDRTFFQADVRITAQPGAISDPENLDADSLAYAKRVSQAFDKAPPTVPGGKRNSLGTPGKIWAIADRMDTWVCCPSFKKWEFACINHGFHRKLMFVKGKPVADLWQPPGGCHPWNHEDYSQIFTLVAGWCWVKGLNDSTPSWKKTADVYMDKTLSKLVRANGPVPALRYHGTPTTPKPKTPCG
jgi:hypothetical protein